jgi:CobQ/CobB/MinD/ParA nucleotide binding domain
VKTITFYSYKGGVGRTLLLANVAKYLCKFGQKVFALDFDLEAPGLHYKLIPAGGRKDPSNNRGLIDYIYSFVVDGSRPTSLREYVRDVERRDDIGGIIHLMRAGDVPTAEYWKRLARINWHDVFYSEGAQGIPFFLELKAKIEREFSPDYLLVDSRTGITEIGGVATTVLPDTIVCLLLNTLENLEGAREVLRSIRRTNRLRGQVPVEFIPVVARIPVSDEAGEAEVLEIVRTFLNEDAPDIEDTLSLPSVSVLHSERSLEVKESLLIEGSGGGDSPLLRDYIRLIAQLVPREVLAPHVVPLVQEAMAGAWDDPEKTEKDLLALCEHSSVPEPHQALVKFYLGTKAAKPKILLSAFRYWRMTGRDDDPVSMKAIRECFAVDLSPDSDAAVPPEFVQAIWRANGAKDVSIGLKLAQAYIKSKRPQNASEVLRTIVDRDDLGPEGITRALELAPLCDDAPLARLLIGLGGNKLPRAAKLGSEFRRAWARAVIKFGSKQEALEFLRDAVPRTGIAFLELLDHYQILLRAEADDVRNRILELLGRLDFENLPRLAMNQTLGSRLFQMMEQLEIDEQDFKSILVGHGMQPQIVQRMFDRLKGIRVGGLRFA